MASSGHHICCDSPDDKLAVEALTSACCVCCLCCPQHCCSEALKRLETLPATCLLWLLTSRRPTTLCTKVCDGETWSCARWPQPTVMTRPGASICSDTAEAWTCCPRWQSSVKISRAGLPLSWFAACPSAHTLLQSRNQGLSEVHRDRSRPMHERDCAAHTPSLYPLRWWRIRCSAAAAR